MSYILFGVAFVFGVATGIVIFALCSISSKESRDEERYHHHRH